MRPRQRTKYRRHCRYPLPARSAIDSVSAMPSLANCRCGRFSHGFAMCAPKNMAKTTNPSNPVSKPQHTIAGASLGHRNSTKQGTCRRSSKHRITNPGLLVIGNGPVQVDSLQMIPSTSPSNQPTKTDTGIRRAKQPTTPRCPRGMVVLPCGLLVLVASYGFTSCVLFEERHASPGTREQVSNRPTRLVRVHHSGSSPFYARTRTTPSSDSSPPGP